MGMQENLSKRLKQRLIVWLDNHQRVDHRLVHKWITEINYSLLNMVSTVTGKPPLSMFFIFCTKTTYNMIKHKGTLDTRIKS